MTFKYGRSTGFLELQLPSGRIITYPKAEIIEDEQFDTTSFTFLDSSGSKTGRMYHEKRGSGVFGGLMLENICQAVCRDVFVEAMPRLEAAGYALRMHTHDEFICETPEGFGSLDEFLRLITQPPALAPDLPVAAKARIPDRLIEIPEPVKAPEVIADNAIDNAVAGLEEESDLEEVDEESPRSCSICRSTRLSYQVCHPCSRHLHRRRWPSSSTSARNVVWSRRTALSG